MKNFGKKTKKQPNVRPSVEKKFNRENKFNFSFRLELRTGNQKTSKFYW